MKIIDIYNKATEPVFSFEFFPPKTLAGEAKLIEAIKNLKVLKPSFVSVTYGAGGSTKDKTIELCSGIQSNFQITTMCHFTCVGASKNDILVTLKRIESEKIHNIIALRGDPSGVGTKFAKHPNGFANASELIEFIKINKFEFGIAGGCYPEKHPDAITFEQDIINLKIKVDSGAEFLITQLFFSNEIFFKFQKKALEAGINVPIIPGIMPITSFSQIEKFKNLAGCYIPDNLVNELDQLKNDEAEFLNRSIEFTSKQCEELLNRGVKGIHFYTLNQSNATIEVMKRLK
ncbi:MAG: methylenetetrahydrofolate reductase [NAD(P)H] [Leptospiraceae bacterium]|nr:methylenetetrahydrofolate reductase [NAD(P)H] [Leptospiraceae bacterium]